MSQFTLCISLLLQKSVDDLLAVSSKVRVDVADVYPVVASLGVLLPDKLVEVEMLLDVVEPPTAFLQVSVDA